MSNIPKHFSTVARALMLVASVLDTEANAGAGAGAGSSFSEGRGGEQVSVELAAC